jgi:hypothetical protein
VTPADDFTDGDTFTLDDGFHLPTTFEFRKVGPFDPDNIPILLSDGQSANAVGDLVRAAINDVTDDLEITADATPGPTVTLTHDRFTELGNILILKDVANPAFVVNGMAGGAGGDCADDEACGDDADCESNNCQANICEPPLPLPPPVSPVSPSLLLRPSSLSSPSAPPPPAPIDRTGPRARAAVVVPPTSATRLRPRRWRR